MANFRIEALRLSVAKGITQMVQRSGITQFQNAVIHPVNFDLTAKRWELSTNVSWRDVNVYERGVFDYRSPTLERNTGEEFTVKNAYGDLMRYCQERFSDLKTEGVKIEDSDILLSLATRRSSSPLLYSVEELQKKGAIRIESRYVSLDNIWQQLHNIDPFVVTQLLMSRLEVKSGELGASLGPRGGYTELGKRIS